MSISLAGEVVAGANVMLDRACVDLLDDHVVLHCPYLGGVAGNFVLSQHSTKFC